MKILKWKILLTAFLLLSVTSVAVAINQLQNQTNGIDTRSSDTSMVSPEGEEPSVVIANPEEQYEADIVSSNITREEAIEISRNTSAVQDFLENAYTYWVNATYLDEEEVRLWKEGNSERFGNLPDDHGVWEITWWIRLKPYGIDQTSLYHYIDEETGEILLELRGIVLL